MNKKISVFTSQIANDNDLLAKWRSNFEKLQKEYYIYKLSHPYVPPGTSSNTNTLGDGGNGGNNEVTYANDIDSNSLKLDLYYSFIKKDSLNKPGTFNVYLIPDIDANKSIIRNAETYELRTNEGKLKIPGVIPAKFSNGYYYFPNLPVGKYLIKICTYYGGFYPYKKTKEGTEVLARDASPPIR